MIAWQRSVGPVLVLGAGDVGSAVGHALFRAGVAVALHDGPAPPAAPRRGMAFADTFFDGQARLAGVTARRLARLADLPAAIDEAAFLPFLAGTAAEALAAAPWAAVVDARMRKRAAPEDLRAWAPLAVGLGPGFVAGDGPEANCHAAVETSWEALGEVVRSGPTLPLRGEPRPIAGVGRERAVYALAAGLFRTGHAIGGRIAAAEPIGTLDGRPLLAPLAGALRGLVLLRERLGAVFRDGDFADLYPALGQPAYAPWRLALVTLMQFREGLSDRQAAEAVRGRIDWKYLLALELDDPRFDHSLLCEFRGRLLDGAATERLLARVLDAAREQGVLRARGRQRTDSTHVLAAIRALNRLELVAETLRAALNAVATVAPGWLRGAAPADWHTRYDRRVEDARLPGSGEH